MLYNDLVKYLVIIIRVETFIGKLSNKVKLEEANSRALYLKKESYKELMIKLGINPDDRSTVEAILQSTQKEN